MKKVGIMSMQRISNYGSFLQAYALKELLKEYGCNVEFVDYHVAPPLIKDIAEESSQIRRKLKKGFEAFNYRAPLSHKIAFIKYKQFWGRRFYPLLEISDTMNYTPELDCLIIGSDEVFNCMQKNTNVGYSLELFGKNNRAQKLISYAASFGNTTLKKLEQYGREKEIAECLKKFDAISVRDCNSASIINSLTDKTLEYHLDPVLVYDYMNCCDKIPVIKTGERYMILYAYSGRISDEEADWISDYAKRKRLKIYAIGGIQKCADKFLDCSPFEVLAYFNKAEEIITDTFHGSIFSVITHKKFTTIIRMSVGIGYGNEEKLTDLLGRLKLTNRMAEDIRDVEKINGQNIDYSFTDQILEKERRKTEKYFGKEIKKCIQN